MAVPMVVTTSAVVVVNPSQAPAAVPTATAVATAYVLTQGAALSAQPRNTGAVTAVLQQRQQPQPQRSPPSNIAIQTLIKFCIDSREVSSEADEQTVLRQFMMLVQKASEERKEVLQDLLRTCYLQWNVFPAQYPQGHSVTPSMLRGVSPPSPLAITSACYSSGAVACVQILWI